MTIGLNLKIVNHGLDQIQRQAKRADRSECMGLLATDPHDSQCLVTLACLLPAKASGSHAEAEPAVLRAAVEELKKLAKAPCGIWHSHGQHSVFSSATDDELIYRIAPAMAESLLRPANVEVSVPVVTSPDSALLPLDDASRLRIDLVGREIDCLPNVRERLAWSRIETSFVDPAERAHLVQERGWLRAVAGGVALTLGIPETGLVQTSTDHSSSVLSARLFSLVVNCRGETYAERVTVHAIAGEMHVSKCKCEVEVVISSEPKPRTAVSILDSRGSDDRYDWAPPEKRLIDTNHRKF